MKRDWLNKKYWKFVQFVDEKAYENKVSKLTKKFSAVQKQGEKFLLKNVGLGRDVVCF